MSLRYIFFMMRRRLAYTIIGLAVTLPLASLYLICAPARYTATALMLLDTRRSTLAENGIRGEPQVDEAFVESQIQVLKSDNVAAIVVNRLNLEQDPEFVPFSAFYEKALGFLRGDRGAAPSKKELRQKALDAFARGLLVTRVGRSYVAQISYTSLSPARATEIANAIADGYVRDQLQSKYDVTKRASSWLQERIADLRSKTIDALKEVQEFKSKNNLIIGADGKISKDLELEQLAGSLAKARADTAQAKSRLLEIEAALSAPNPDAISGAAVTDALNSPVITKLRQQYLEDKQQAGIWTHRYGANHQAVSHLEAEMDGLLRAIREEMERIKETYRNELAVARSREESIEKRLFEIFQNDAGNRRLEVTLRELESVASTYRATYENFLNKYTQIVEQQSFPSSEARVITGAATASKTWPKAGLTLALAALVGAAFGIAAALVGGQTDRAVYATGQLTRETGASYVSVLLDPEPKRRRLCPALPSRWRPKSSTAKAAPPKHAEAEKETHALIPLYGRWVEPFSLFWEEIRNIKILIDLKRMSEKVNTVAIVSARPNEGKSTVAVGVAASIAETGKRVLVIDLNFRNPSLTRLFGMQGGASVTEALNGEAGLSDVVVRSERYGFDFLGAPTNIRPLDMIEALQSEIMVRLIEIASQEYEYVLVDLPSVLSAPDVRAYGHLFDAFVMVVEWGKTTLDDVHSALRAARVVRERLLGMVLNKVDIAAMRQLEADGGFTERWRA
jgi:polysaccharide biosynthesis transport protein